MIQDIHFSMIIPIDALNCVLGVDFEGKLYRIYVDPRENTYTVTPLEERKTKP